MYWNNIQKQDVFLLLISLILSLDVAGCSMKTEVTGKVIRYTGPGYVKYDTYRAEQGKKFAALHENLQVIYEPIYSGGYNNKILTMAVSGELYDVFIVYGPANLTDWAKRGILLDITQYVKEDNSLNIDEYYPQLIEDCKVEERLFGLPNNVGSTGLFYNKKNFDEYGLSYPDKSWDWNTFLEVAKRLTKRNNSMTERYGGALESACIEMLIRQNGGAYWSQKRTRCIIDSPNAVEALTFYNELMNKYKVIPVLTETREKGGYLIFMDGRASMYIGGNWVISILKDKKELEWHVGPVPKLKNRMAPGGGIQWAAYSKTKDPKLAYEFIKYLSSKDSVKYLIDIGDSIPTDRSKESIEYFLNNKLASRQDNQVFIDAMEESYGDKDSFSPYLEMALLEQKEIFRIEFEACLFGVQTPAETLRKIEEKINRSAKKAE